MSSTSLARKAFADSRAEVAAWRLDHPERSILTKERSRSTLAPIACGGDWDGGGPLIRAARAIMEGRSSATALVEAALAQVEAHKHLNGMAFVAAEAALRRPGSWTGKLGPVKSGVPCTGFPSL